MQLLASCHIIKYTFSILVSFDIFCTTYSKLISYITAYSRWSSKIRSLLSVFWKVMSQCLVFFWAGRNWWFRAIRVGKFD